MGRREGGKTEREKEREVGGGEEGGKREREWEGEGETEE